MIFFGFLVTGKNIKILLEPFFSLSTSYYRLVCLFVCKGLCSVPLMGTGMQEQPLVRPFPYPAWQYKSQQTSTLGSPPSSEWGGVGRDQDIYCILLPKAMPMQFM